MLEYDFNNVKGWTEEQIKNGEYHDYSDTVIRKDGRGNKRRYKKIPERRDWLNQSLFLCVIS